MNSCDSFSIGGCYPIKTTESTFYEITPAVLSFARRELNSIKDAETLVTKLLNSTAVVNPNPDADTEPVNAPALVTAPCDGENLDDVAAHEALVVVKDAEAQLALTGTGVQEALNDCEANDADTATNEALEKEEDSSQLV